MSESTRQREVLRSYQSWLASSSGFIKADGKDGFDQRFHADGSSLKSSNDKALIAFAQLGCLRLHAKRAIVSLISTDREYIIAEATKSLSLVSGRVAPDEDDELWFGNASIPREQGISADALTPDEYTATSGDQSYTCPAMVVDDLTVDSRYASKGFAGQGVTFYCAVPLVSNSGLPIGVYCVTDDKPRAGLTPGELVFMRDMAEIVMGHLNTFRHVAARSRGEKMILGLQRFSQGRSSIYNRNETDHHSPSPGVRHDLGEDLAPKPSFKGMQIVNADPRVLQDVLRLSSAQKINSASRAHQPPVSAPQPAVQSLSDQPTLRADREAEVEAVARALDTTKRRYGQGRVIPKEVLKIYSRAANVLRECASADGVVFYDTFSIGSAKQSRPPDLHHSQSNSPDRDSWSEDMSDSSRSDRGDPGSRSRSTSSDSGLSSAGHPLHTLSSKGKAAPMLGYSLDITIESSASAKTIHQIGMNETTIRRFTRTYPRGKIFYFDADGNVSASDSDSQQDKPRGRSHGRTDQDARHKTSRANFATRDVAEELIRLVPGARSIVWLPLWDQTKQQWAAGAFLWSQRPEQLLTAREDLSYLSIFGTCIVAEITRADIMSITEAKTTFIANMSHELRSPLHGILGSIEFLQETALDGFQSSMASAVETCGRTLLETVEHVLDYAKINSVANKPSKARGSDNTSTDEITLGQHTSDSHKLEDVFDLAITVEEVADAVFAGQSFSAAGSRRKTKSPIDESIFPDGKSRTEVRTNIERGAAEFASKVKVTLNIEHQDSWWVRTQPGAIRRIVMNILGNALKYTETGMIDIELRKDKDFHAQTFRQLVCITIRDTGKGMSRDFLDNHAFTPFTQESSFADGAGLGLSIVHRLVHSLGGKIDVQSRKGVGTTFRVWLNIPFVQKPLLKNSSVPGGAGHGPEDIISRTSGMNMCILAPHPQAAEPSGIRAFLDDDPRPELSEVTIRQIASTWLGMKNDRVHSMDGITADIFCYAEPPPVEYLLKNHGKPASGTEIPLVIVTTNAFESASLTANGIGELSDLGRIIEIVSQPVGPQKLAKTISRCLRRLDLLAQEVDLRESHQAHPAVREITHKSGISAESVTLSRPPANRKTENPNAGAQEPSNVGNKGGQASGHRRRSSSHVVEKQEVGKVIPILSRVQSTPHASDPALLPALGFGGSGPVLLVDDNEINLRLLVALMRKSKRPYKEARNGVEAVKAYRDAAADPSTTFKHVLMDVSMPILNGIEATRQIREIERQLKADKPAVIIVLTGQVSEGTRKDVFHAGADHFLPKPVRFQALNKILETMQERREEGEEVVATIAAVFATEK